MQKKKSKTLKQHILLIGIGNALSKIMMFAASIFIANKLLEEGNGAVGTAFVIVNYLYLLVFAGVETVATRDTAGADAKTLRGFTGELLLIRSVAAVLLFSFTWIAGSYIPGLTGRMVQLYALSIIPQAFNLVNLYYGVEWSWPVAIYFVGGRIIYLSILLLNVKGIEDAGWVPLAFAVAIFAENIFLLILWLKKHGAKIYKGFGKFFLKRWEAALPVTFSIAFLVMHENSAGVILRFTKGESAAGYYYASYRLVFVAISLTLLLSYIFLSRISSLRKNSPDKVRSFFTKSCLIAFAGGLLLSVCGTFLAKPIVSLLYKPEYAESGVLLTVAVWQMCIAPVRVLCFQTINAFHAQVKMLKLIIPGVAISIIAVLAGINYYGLLGAVYGTIVGEIIIMTTLFIFSLRLVPRKFD